MYAGSKPGLVIRCRTVRVGAVLLIGLALGVSAARSHADGVFVRCKILEPAGDKFRVSTGGHRHDGKRNQWYLPSESLEVTGGQWSAWIDAGTWDLHKRLNREGGIAEWPSMKLSVFATGTNPPVQACRLGMQLAVAPAEDGVVITCAESSESATVAFLLPHPLKANAAEFETGSQMTARHLRWAQEAAGKKPPALKRFDLITSIWGHYDPALARQSTESLRLLGFNVIGGVPVPVMRDAGMRTYTATWHYGPDPDAMDESWKRSEGAQIARAQATVEGAWTYSNMAHYVVSDEIQALDFRGVETNRLNGWFRGYLRDRGVTDADLGRPLDQVEYPAKALFEKTLPREADLPTRKRMYYAAKFGQWWSVRQLRHTSDLVHSALPKVRAETLPSDHGFFNAWGPPHMGMSYRMLDLFEIGAQSAVDILAVEDWLGLNHMYGPNSTWSGAQSFGYLSAIMRSSIKGRPIALRGLITPSDDGFLRLKAFSNLGQGSKSFFFWTFGPTYIGTENYWSDLRSEYDGIAKVTRALAKAEPILYDAQPVSDPVAILYSVSHDLWHTDNAGAFVETRLLWHGLRHLSAQPDFLREEDLESGRLQGYKVLYVSGWCVSRKASAAIDAWVKAGGVLYLSGGACTRDEFYEPYVPTFAAEIWPALAAAQMKTDYYRYNERVDLPTIPPLTRVTVTLTNGTFELPVIGARLDLRPEIAVPLAVFKDGKPAATLVSYGAGKILALGFMPMLAYGQMAGFKPTTLEEKWPMEPREIIRLPLSTAGVRPVVQCDTPVVETSLLTGPAGSALVLVNYTYQPIGNLALEVDLPHAVGKITRVEQGRIRSTKNGDRLALELPLAWTDIVLLPRK